MLNVALTCEMERTHASFVHGCLQKKRDVDVEGREGRTFHVFYPGGRREGWAASALKTRRVDTRKFFTPSERLLLQDTAECSTKVPLHETRATPAALQHECPLRYTHGHPLRRKLRGTPRTNDSGNPLSSLVVLLRFPLRSSRHTLHRKV